MKIISDYHMHTPLCRHAVGEPAEYAQQALAVGLQEIGFSDHAPLVAYHIPDVCMENSELPRYHQMIRQVQAQYQGRLNIRLGIEADFVPGFEQQTQAILDAFPYDYVIGSVHFLDGWCFDNPDDIESWKQEDVNAVYLKYYDFLRRSAQSGLFNVMGHADLVKKFGHRPTIDMRDEIKKTAAVFRQAGVAVEINTAGLRKPVKEIYPALDALKIYRQEKVWMTFGSDSHQPSEVGMDFDLARDWALAAGYAEYVRFAGRKVSTVEKL